MGSMTTTGLLAHSSCMRSPCPSWSRLMPFSSNSLRICISGTSAVTWDRLTPSPPCRCRRRDGRGRAALAMIAPRAGFRCLDGELAEYPCTERASHAQPPIPAGDTPGEVAATAKASFSRTISRRPFRFESDGGRVIVDGAPVGTLRIAGVRGMPSSPAGLRRRRRIGSPEGLRAGRAAPGAPPRVTSGSSAPSKPSCSPSSAEPPTSEPEVLGGAALL